MSWTQPLEDDSTPSTPASPPANLFALDGGRKRPPIRQVMDADWAALTGSTYTPSAFYPGNARMANSGMRQRVKVTNAGMSPALYDTIMTVANDPALPYRGSLAAFLRDAAVHRLGMIKAMAENGERDLDDVAATALDGFHASFEAAEKRAKRSDFQASFTAAKEEFLQQLETERKISNWRGILAICDDMVEWCDGMDDEYAGLIMDTVRYWRSDKVIPNHFPRPRHV